LIFIGTTGIDVYKSTGLENGQIAVDARRSMWLSQRDADVRVGSRSGTFKRNSPAYGAASFYLKSNDGYVSLFNDRVVNNPSAYQFVAKWTKGNSFKSANIPYYFNGFGKCGNSVYGIGGSRAGTGPWPIKLFSLEFAERMTLRTLGAQDANPNNSNMVLLGDLVCLKDEVHYLWLSPASNNQPAAVWLTSTSLSTGKSIEKKLYDAGTQETMNDSLPWWAPRSTHLIGASLFFVDGRGTLREIDLAQSRLKRATKLKGTPTRRDVTATTSWNGGRLGILYQPDNGPATLTLYQVPSGKIISKQSLPAVTHVLASDEALSLYDLHIW